MRLIFLLLLSLFLYINCKANDYEQLSLSDINSSASVVLLVKKSKNYIAHYKTLVNNRQYEYQRYRFEVIKTLAVYSRSLSEKTFQKGSEIIVAQRDEHFKMVKFRYDDIMVFKDNESGYSPKSDLNVLDTLVVFVNIDWNKKNRFKSVTFTANNSFESLPEYLKSGIINSPEITDDNK